ncbi:hypothetical protein A2926_01070 [Candidatus Giovannonibacteria bacterium RIFCSPLOWO2_01_FULL_44_40]|uniref:DNA 3'-5' helicase n=1 Tax=Candidatus Giovannonibacteria bacterium RIFCSPHIGHO2_01_FULL_45_23 TaxID=1798325 RepID=A0A1F5VGP7_9BACT|nr:MAG: hypothetical protein A2834_02620 [Candidatus Giovannonibacteria bacterium RIFCSPHIGHO2_01_FULL_45_23]OGF75175.1 MAG: hypothetical protein A3C77_03780 [Candidatus Giovannonibacteria bacterium RIFCSPHIGHO2_02_FULL_45_13]OGF80028.1 MAG: hypothetical protein A2926_01070 [Candidatus Giovannonibacteria bacterium RIFCSPLOWO2_01_FULL_44_40]
MANPEALNSKQKEAVETTDGPVLVIAGAGAGKTLVIAERIKYLIEKGAPPESILAVTFTNKAAGEMRARLRSPTSNIQFHTSNLPFIGTFHALGLLIIRENLEKLNIGGNFTILDEDDSLKLIKECLLELKIDPKEFDPSRIRNKISRLKNQLVSAKEFSENPPDGEASSFFDRQLGKVWRLYEEKTQKRNLLDFDDLLLQPTRLLRRSSDLLKKYQARWRYIHIDEYQDTNEVQYVLSKMLAGAHRNIMAVGDIDQAIYSWRGADFKNVLNFRRDWPDAKVVFLEENYRSTDIILEAANAVIVRNKLRIPKNLWTKRAGSNQIRVIFASDEKRESEFVANEIQFLRRDANIKLGDIAALYRTNAQSRALEEIFLARDIPYKITGVRFYERREIKDLAAYLRFIQNPADEFSKKRIINVPPRKKKKIDFDELINNLREESKKTSPHEFLKILIKKIGYREYISDLPAGKAGGTDRGIERLQNVEEFLGLAREMENIEKFLEHISLFAADDKYDSVKDKVNLMTIHAAKGLEFEAVFVVGLEEGVFPHMLSLGPEDLEEERRLCYVAITRAKNHLYLALAARRALFGERSSNKPSRFLSEIPEHLLVYVNKPNENEEEIIIE